MYIRMQFIYKHVPHDIGIYICHQMLTAIFIYIFIQSVKRLKLI